MVFPSGCGVNLAVVAALKARRNLSLRVGGDANENGFTFRYPRWAVRLFGILMEE